MGIPAGTRQYSMKNIGRRHFCSLSDAADVCAPPCCHRKGMPLFQTGGRSGRGGNHTFLDRHAAAGNAPRICIGRKAGWAEKADGGAEERDAMVEFSTMTEHEIFAWLKAYAAQRGKAVEPQALETLIQRVGTDMQTVATEMEKICCYAEERDRITRKDVLDISSQTLEANAFEIVDLLAMGKRRQAAEQIDLLLSRGKLHPNVHGCCGVPAPPAFGRPPGLGGRQKRAGCRCKGAGPSFCCTAYGKAGRDNADRGSKTGLAGLNGSGFCPEERAHEGGQGGAGNGTLASVSC